jgi:hypothetical protein
MNGIVEAEEFRLLDSEGRLRGRLGLDGEPRRPGGSECLGHGRNDWQRRRIQVT